LSEVLFEGYTEDELLALPKEQIEAMILTGQPVIFRAGSATILGEFRVEGNRLRIELAQIEGGGEGVLVAIRALARRYAQLHQLAAIEWVVDAVHCAQPNLKLRRVLERRGFVIKALPLSVKPAIYLSRLEYSIQHRLPSICRTTSRTRPPGPRACWMARVPSFEPRAQATRHA
jgi:hypothetical protein